MFFCISRELQSGPCLPRLSSLLIRWPELVPSLFRAATEKGRVSAHSPVCLLDRSGQCLSPLPPAGMGHEMVSELPPGPCLLRWFEQEYSLSCCREQFPCVGGQAPIHGSLARQWPSIHPLLQLLHQGGVGCRMRCEQLSTDTRSDCSLVTWRHFNGLQETHNSCSSCLESSSRLSTSGCRLAPHQLVLHWLPLRGLRRSSARCS